MVWVRRVGEWVVIVTTAALFLCAVLLAGSAGYQFIGAVYYSSYSGFYVNRSGMEAAFTAGKGALSAAAGLSVIWLLSGIRQRLT